MQSPGAAEFSEVVDLTVVDERLIVRPDHRLVAFRPETDDSQTSVPGSNPLGPPLPVGVGASMPERLEDLGDLLRAEVGRSRRQEQSAHFYYFSS